MHDLQQILRITTNIGMGPHPQTKSTVRAKNTRNQKTLTLRENEKVQGRSWSADQRERRSKKIRKRNIEQVL